MQSGMNQDRTLTRAFRGTLITYLAAVGISFQQHLLGLVVIERNGALKVIVEPELRTASNTHTLSISTHRQYWHVTDRHHHIPHAIHVYVSK